MRSASTLALIAVFAATTLPAAAGPGLPFLPQSPGQRLPYHLTRSVQTADGPQTSATAFTIVRRAGSTYVIERTGPGGPPNLSVLKAAPDGTLALSEDAQGAAADADLSDVLFALNLAILATREGDPTGSGAWNADIPIAPGARPTTVSILMQPGRLAGTEFDFGGIGQAALPLAPAVKPPGPITVTVHVDGHAGAGRVQRIAFVQSRVFTVAGAPYVNAGTWSLTADAPVR
jgi:hypothetical protein